MFGELTSPPDLESSASDKAQFTRCFKISRDPQCGCMEICEGNWQMKSPGISIDFLFQEGVSVFSSLKALDNILWSYLFHGSLR